MTLHYHGTPITPNTILAGLAGRCFCVSYAAPAQVARCHQLGQSVMLDNGAFSLWTRKQDTDWAGFVAWAKPWLEYPTTWAVAPDVIDGDEEDNDQLLSWLFNHDREVWQRCAPVWHMHESLDRLKRLCAGYERVCVGSSGQYRDLLTPQWHRRMEQAMNAVCLNDTPWLHMLRGMALSDGPYPFASVDSTDVARNHAGNNTRRTPRKDAAEMAARWDSKQCPPRWAFREQLEIAA